MSCDYYADTQITGSPDDIQRLADVVEKNIQETSPDMLDVSLEGIAGCRLKSYRVARGSWAARRGISRRGSEIRWRAGRSSTCQKG